MPKSFAIWFNRAPGSRSSVTRTTSSRNSLGYGAGMVHIHPCGVGTPQIVCHLYLHQSLLSTATPADDALLGDPRLQAATDRHSASL